MLRARRPKEAALRRGFKARTLGESCLFYVDPAGRPRRMGKRIL